jgi:hypothetical protein
MRGRWRFSISRLIVGLIGIDNGLRGCGQAGRVRGMALNLQRILIEKTWRFSL